MEVAEGVYLSGTRNHMNIFQVEENPYLDEQDVVTFLDPHTELIPLVSASHIWLISRAWEIAGTRYADPNLAKRSASKLLCNDDGVTSLEYYHCRTSGGGSFLTGLANSFSPLYFTVRQLKEVMPTEQPSDLAYVFGDGLFDLQEYPEGFPRPGGCVCSPFGARCFGWASIARRNEITTGTTKVMLRYFEGERLFCS